MTNLVSRVAGAKHGIEDLPQQIAGHICVWHTDTTCTAYLKVQPPDES